MSNICLLLSKMIGGRKGPPPTPTYTISGTITGDVVEGVTVALTGDATDSTTTAADGTYSFTGVVDGSYTVTPTLAGYTFAPTDASVTVSGADNTGNDFVSSVQTLTLPYTWSASELTEAAGTQMAAISGWAVHPSAAVGGIVTDSNLADGNSYTPSGVTKAWFLFSTGDSNWVGNIFTLPYKVPATSAGIRFGMLTKFGDSGRVGGGAQIYRIIPGTEGVASPIQANIRWQDDTGKTRLYCGYVDDGANAVEFNFPAYTGNVGAGDSPSGEEWVWLQAEVNFSADTVTGRIVKQQTGAGRYTTEAMSAEGQAAGAFPQMATIGCAHNDTANAAYDQWIAKFWIGSLTDDWPV